MDHHSIGREDYSFTDDSSADQLPSFDLRTVESIRNSDKMAPPKNMLNHSDDCILLLDLSGHIKGASKKALEALELESFEALADRPWETLWPEHMQPRVSAALQSARDGGTSRLTGHSRTMSGAERWWDVVVSLNPAGQMTGPEITVIFSDATAHRTREKKLRWLTTHDELTGLPNRRLFREYFDQLFEIAESDARALGLVLFSMDRLKQVNESFGPDGGDALLKTFATRLREKFGNRNVATRLGGDKFALILVDIPRERNVAEIVAALLPRLCDPVPFAAHMIDCGVSAGIAMFPEHANTVGDLFCYAGAALDIAKARGPGHVHCFDSGIRQTLQRQSSLAEIARQAIVNDWIRPRYHLKADPRTGQVMGYEALPGWNLPKGFLFPEDALEAAFQDPDRAALRSDMMLDKIIVDMQRTGMSLPVTIKVTCADVHREDFADRLLARLASAGISPARIELDVEKAVSMHHDPAKIGQMLRSLTNQGIRIVPGAATPR